MDRRPRGFEPHLLHNILASAWKIRVTARPLRIRLRVDFQFTTMLFVSFMATEKTCSDGRVVKALELSSNLYNTFSTVSYYQVEKSVPSGDRTRSQKNYFSKFTCMLFVSFITTEKNCSDGRVVKALDLSSNLHNTISTIFYYPVEKFAWVADRTRSE